MSILVDLKNGALLGAPNWKPSADAGHLSTDIPLGLHILYHHKSLN